MNSSGTADSWFDYYPFGQLLDGRNQIGSADPRYIFTGKERDVESQYDYFGARYYDGRTARWMSVDPLSHKHADYSPYAYVYNNPTRLIDPLGLDSLQRSQIVAKAREYIDKRPKGNSYQMGAKGKPGEKVDCSGLASGSVKAAGEPNPNRGKGESGVLRIESNTKPVFSFELQAGNLVSFRKAGGGYEYHIGVVEKILERVDGAAVRFSYIDSQSPTGPGQREFDVRATGSLSVHSFLKADTRPDLPAANLAGQDNTRVYVSSSHVTN